MADPAVEGAVQEPNTRCPACRAPLRAAGGEKAVCPQCGGSFECLFAAAAPPPPVPGRLGKCVFHPDVDATGRCLRCRKGICGVCTFHTALGRYCPECMTAPARGGAASRSLALAITSLVLAILGILSYLPFFAVVASIGSEADQEVAGALFAYLILGLSIAGLATGFIGHERAKRAGSPLGIIAIVLNAIVIGIFALLMIAGAAMGK